LDAYAHQDLPFEQLVEALQPERDLRQPPLVQVLFALQNAPLPPLTLDGLTLQLQPVASTAAHLDLTVLLFETDAGIQATWEYSTDLFDASTITRMAGHFAILLAGLCAGLDQPIMQLPLLTAAEHQQIVVDWNATAAAYPRSACIHNLIAEQAARTPDAVAAVYADSSLTYRELHERANRLAHYLQQRGVGPDMRVGICMERSLEQVIGLLGILKAGGAYVPLDPTYPAARLAYIAADTQMTVALTQRQLRDRLPSQIAHIIWFDADWPAIAAQPSAALESTTRPGHLAYVIYTSGSTGAPKGVMIAHQSLVNYVEAACKEYALASHDRVLQFASISFDASAEEIFPSLACGAALVLRTPELLATTAAFLRTLRAWRLTVVSLPTAFWHELTARMEADSEGLASIRLMIIGGERALPARVESWRRHAPAQVRLVNTYGPTEATIVTTRYDLSATEYSRVACVHELFAAQAARTPHAVALVFDRRTTSDGQAVFGVQHLTYAELNRRANQLAYHLRSLGVGPESRVGIGMERSLELIVGLLGILKAGGAYVPLDLTYPPERLSFMLDDTQAQVLITALKDEGRRTEDDGADAPFAVRRSSLVTRQLVDLAADWPQIAQQPDSNPASDTTAESLAYVIYTSGSTGTPKGVAIPHHGVTRLVCGASYARLDATRTLLQMAPISFDASTFEIWGALLHGARCVLFGERVPTADEIGRALAQFDVSTLWLTAALFNSVIDTDPAALIGVEQLLIGGEALSVAHVQRALQLLPGTQIINGYGPTESTTFACCYPIPRARHSDATAIPIGRPISNTTVYLLDRALQPTPIGVAGELYIGGDGLARGYLDRPDLTAERFVPNPFVETTDDRRPTTDDRATDDQPFALRPSSFARLYRTGDLARYLVDGTIEFLGRSDHQVKVRGFRIELGEIETLLQQHPAVRAAAVLARADAPGDMRLVAYVVPADDERRGTNDERADSSFVPRPSSIIQESRDFLSERLPAYMIPAAFVLLDALPLSPNGKLDRAALPAPDSARPDLGNAYVAPRSATERALADIWQQVLGRDLVGIHDNFFALGGHSLLATQVVARVRTVVQVELPLRALFEAPTVAGLSARIDALRDASQLASAPPIVPVARTSDLPLALAQQRLWFLDQLQPGGFAYNLPAAVRMAGPLDLGVFQRSLSEIVRRHEALRTTFAVAHGQPVQVIAAPQRLVLPVVDLRALPSELRERLAAQYAIAEARRPFDLARGPLLRVTLLSLADAEHILLVTMHHIISDGWSISVFIRELVAIFEAFSVGAASPLPELPIQYADFAYWQRTWLQGAPGLDQPSPIQAQLAYWQRQLGGALPVLALPTDRPRPAIQTFRGAHQALSVPAQLTAALKELGQREGATVFMVLLAAFNGLLQRYTAQDDILVGSPIASRTQRATEELIGCFINTLVLRTDLAGNPDFRTLLGRVREAALGAYAHQDVPFEQLVDVLQPERDLSRNPLFQVLFTLQNTPISIMRLPGLTLTLLDADNGASQFDLALNLTELPEGLSGQLTYNVDLFDAATIARLSGHFCTLLAGIVAEPARPLAELRCLTSAEQQQLLVDWNATQAALPQDRTMAQLFEAQAARTPDAVALVFEDRQLTYAELNARANRLAHHLRAQGVTTEVRVALCMERSIELLIGLFGVLKAGGAYLPLDPTYPAERLAFMLEDSQAAMLITVKDERRTTNDEGVNPFFALRPSSSVKIVHLAADWPQIALRSARNPRGAATSGNLAYVIYTSGSTGRPKGVMITQRNLVNFFTGMDARLGSAAPGTWLAVTSVSFDISVLELLWTLARGFRVVVQDELAGTFRATQRASAVATRPIAFSLFYFGSDDRAISGDIYKLLLDGAVFADRNGFSAVWTPERHFHAFGGLYPNPSVMSAAIAALTQRIQIRAGSVVLPLHNPIRVAEEWSVVDNLSHGRVGISFASGWHADDFVFAPEQYRDRKAVMLRQIEIVRDLWRGNSQSFVGGAGNQVDVAILPRPIQPELPFWLTAAGSPETFRSAGEAGAGLLTHLLGQSIDELAEKILVYREAWRAQGYAGAGHVTLMLHTFVGDDLATIRDKVREPFRNYLRTSIGLLKGMARSLGHDMDAADFSESDMQAVLDHAFERYFETSGLFGTPDSCLPLIDRLKAIGVDEVACLIDFGVAVDEVIASFPQLNRLRERSNPAPQGDRADYSLPAQLSRYNVTHLQCTPSMATMLLADPAAVRALGGVRQLLLGGEALPAALAEQLRATITAEIHNMYGPTETTIWSTTQPISATSGAVAIGRPISNTTIYILDQHQRPVPIGIPGDLLIGGAGLARGYLARPELTAERFVPNPFVDERRTTKDEESDSSFVLRPSSRLYATGDLARYRPDGSIEYLGRSDQQIKLRGYRIEPGEIAAALARHPSVREAVVLARTDAPGEQRLVAYVVPADDERRTPNDERADSSFVPRPSSIIQELRDFLSERLPDYMVPSAFVLLDALPLTPNGKLDRKALPAPTTAPLGQDQPFVAPRTPEEQLLAEIWASVLHVEQVGIHDTFFALGGHSLLATQLISRVRESLRVELPLRALFEAPTVAGMAERIAAARHEPQASFAPSIVPVPREGALPLSFAQQRLWFLEQMQPDSSAYNVPSGLRLTGALDLAAVQHCLNAITARHESLRASFVTVDGEPRQVFAATLHVPLRVVDLRGLPEAIRETTVEAIGDAESRERFDLAYDQLMRAILLRLGEQSHILLLTMHHVVSDIWSTGVLVRELSAFYAAFTSGQPAALPALPIQYADYAVWQRRWLQGAVLNEQLAYWRTQLAGAAPTLDLPTDFARPPLQSFRGATLPFTLSPLLTAQLHIISREVGVTLFMTLLAGFQVLMARYSGQDDIVVGSPIANRTRSEIEGLIGFFANTLVLRGDLSGSPTLRELLGRVRGTALDAYAHQDLPFEQLVEALAPMRDLRFAPLFQVMFVLENAPQSALHTPGLELEPLRVFSQTAKFDLTLLLQEHGDELVGMVEYSTDLFEPATITRLVTHYQTLLAGFAARLKQPISTLALLPEAQRQQLLVDWNDTQVPHAQDQCLHQLIEAQAERTPDAVAVIFDGAYLTYQGVNQRANQLARYLQHRGVGPDVPVGLCLKRSLELMVGVLGILKAGGAYLPLDPAYPKDRVAFMLADSQAPILLTQTGLLPSMPAHDIQVILLDADWERFAQNCTENLCHSSVPSNLAYVIYTSGSTGRPKGIAIEHRSGVALVRWTDGRYTQADLAHVLASTSICFDHSFFELFVPLSRGGAITMVENVLELLDLPTADDITLIHTVPSAIATLLETNSIPASVRCVNLAGEPLQTRLVGQLYQRTNITKVLDLYGPSEVTVYSTAALRRGSGSPTIGRPIDNTQIYILDANLEPVPLGIPGELYIGGRGLGRSYYRRPDLTAERFVPNPFVDERRMTNDEGPDSSLVLGPASFVRLYRTGDLARYQADGNIEFLGRVDHQIKLRGFRIELAEIEAVLREHPAVREAVALVRQDASGDKRLVAYVVPTEDERRTTNDEGADSSFVPRPSSSIQELRDFLREYLPNYMLPESVVWLDALPLTPNGKLDRKALPMPERSAPAQDVTYVAPRTPIEDLVATIWSKVLDRQVGVFDNFFVLGGHSLLATQVVSKLRTSFAVELPLSSLFEAPTVAELAKRVAAAQQAEQALPAPPLLPVARDTALPLSFAQQRLWFFQQLEPGNPFYTIPAALRLTGMLDLSALERSLSAIMRRHEALRTVFVTRDGRPAQVVLPALPLRLPLVDLQQLAAEARDAEALRLATAEAQRPFDLVVGPLFRIVVLRLGPAEYALMLTMHHIISDAWSIGVLIRELTSLYAAFTSDRPAALPALPIQYADYAIWQRGWLQGTVVDEQLAYWRAQLAGAPPLLDLPTDFARPAVQSFRGAVMSFALPPLLTAQLHTVSRQVGVTLFMTLLAGFQVLMARYSGQDDIVVGSPIANRTRSEIEDLIGFFVNTLVLRGDLAGDPTLRELLEQVRATALAAYAHQDVPFEQLVEVLAPTRDLRFAPLFQVMFVMENAPLPALHMAGLELAPLPIASETAKFDLTLLIEEQGGELVGMVEYSTDLFEPATITRLLAHYQMLLSGFAARLGQPISTLALLTAAEQEQLISWPVAQPGYLRAGDVLQRIAAHAEQRPDAIALLGDGAHLTYRELNQRANQLAHYLRGLGVGPEARVGLSMERSLELVIGIFGIFKAGGVYVPLDPAYPAERLAFIRDDAQIAVLITTTKDERRRATDDLEESQTSIVNHTSKIVNLTNDWPLIAREPAANLSGGAGAEHPAYVIYTSGSTGHPKGVVVEHRSLQNTLTASQERFGFQPSDVMPALASVAFDIALFELFNPLLAGGTVLLLTRDQVLDLPQLPATLARCTVFHAVPSLMQQIVQASAAAGARASGTNIRMVFVGGDAVPPALLAELHATFPLADVVLLYGPTEATIICMSYVSREQPIDRFLIGSPLPNMQAQLYDRQGRLVPIGVAGELYLGGAGLARGYLDRPDLTAERFVPNPFVDERRTTNDEGPDSSLLLGPSSFGRLYRTGDRARVRSDGTLEFLGRVDDQVKIRGVRIELGEVEAVLRSHADVREVAVLALAAGSDAKRLVAYVVPLEDERRTTNDEGVDSSMAHRPSSFVAELRSFVQAKLPDYMVPSAFVLLDALPLNTRGKLDRRALPLPDATRPELDTAYVAPRTPAEEVIAGIWAAVLVLAQVGVNDNFFTLGGHSLLATQVMSRVSTAFDFDIPLRQLFEAPTVAGLAAFVTAGQSGPLRAAKPPLLPVRRDQPLPLSFAQQRLWFLDRLQPGNAAYNMPVAVRLTGALDVAALQMSLRAIVQRHEAIRTTFAMHDGQPVQVIAPALRVPLLLLDLQDLPDGQQALALEQRVSAEAQSPFDLTRGPLLRTTLVRLDATAYVLLLTMHHSVSDGWSMSVAIRELGLLYSAFVQGRPAPLPALPLQYADYALWQRDWLQGAVLDEQLAYWRRQLGGALPVLDLPADRPHTAASAPNAGSQTLALSKDLSEQLKQLSQREGATPFMILLSAFTLLLGRYTGQDDIVVGAPIANRNQTETEGLIGFFINTLVLRTDLAGNPSFQELIGRVREMLLGAYAHQDLPFEKLVEELQPERSLERNPFFDVLFNFINTPQTQLELPQLNLDVVEQPEGGSKFWITLYVAEQDGGFDLRATYQQRLFSAAYITTLLNQFAELLAQIAAQPDRSISSYSLVPQGYQSALPDPTVALPEPSYELVTTMFNCWAGRMPDQPAITQGSQVWTYQELSRSAHGIARKLLAHDLQPGDAVAVFGGRSFGFIASMLGVLMAGGVLVPIDRGLPSNRQRLMIQAAQANLLLYIGERRPEDEWIAECAPLTILDVPSASGPALDPHSAQQGALPLPDVARDSAAYIFFTSGTTGTPKGVLGCHKGLSHFLTWQRETFAVGPHDRCAQLTGLSFDVVLRDILLPLTSGATLCLPDSDGPFGADQLVAWLAREQVSLLHTVPALAESWLTNLTTHVSLGNLRRVFFAGEVLTERLITRWRATFPASGEIINLYGPTETTLAKCFYRVPADLLPGAQPVGIPMPQTQALVLAAGARLCGIGELGEIVLRTPFRSFGYVNAPDEQRRRFVRNPFRDDDRDLLYYTGDLGRYRADGLLEVVGRSDQQIKIRGLRVELGEIEVLLRQHPAVQQAAVITNTDDAGELRLVAYVVPAETQNDENRAMNSSALSVQHSALGGELRRFLKEYLPAAMVPAAFMYLDALPLTPNGKTDRRALPLPDWQHPERDTAFVMPRTEVEQTIAGVWQAVLGVEQVGVHDNFFDLGGHSLLVVQIQTQLREQLGQDIPLVKLFQYPTVHALTAYLQQQQQRAEPVEVQKSQARSELRKAAMNRRRRGSS
jgi:natural product biosynthesis luciferase-like monooxygenase protein/amino acid adenylation domain-containing protein